MYLKKKTQTHKNHVLTSPLSVQRKHYRVPPIFFSVFTVQNNNCVCYIFKYFDLQLRNSSTLATSCEELTHWKRLWCWEELGAGGKGDNRRWDDLMASLTWWTRVWVNSGSWRWTRRPGLLRFMESQRVGHDWATDWTELIWSKWKTRNRWERHYFWWKYKKKRLYQEGLQSSASHLLSFQ